MENENNFKETVSSLFKGMDGFVSAKTVVGDAIHVGDTIILPLVDVSFGVGAGAFAGDKKNNGGGGLAGKMTPCAVLVIQNGTTKLVNVKNQDGLTKVLDMVPDFVSGNGMNREIVRPSFIHKVESVMKIQEKVSGHVSGDYEMVWDEDKCQFVMKTIDNGQVSMDDLEKEEDTKQEYAQLNPAKPQLEEGKEDAEDVIEGVYREINAEDDKDDGNAEDIQYDEPEN